MIIISLARPERETFVLEVDAKMFRVNKGFVFGSLVVIGILITLYTVFW
jgi:SSS family solute:Na+ symporter